MRNFLNKSTYLSVAGGLILSVVAVTGVAFATPTEEQPVEVAKATTEVKALEKKPVVEAPVQLTAHDKQQIQCMTENTYFEAAHEPYRGRIAVNNVVMNRVKDSRFPKTPCAVINQRTRRVCQFSWKCEGGKRVGDRSAYREARQIAEKVYLGNYGDVTRGAQFYHADYVSPSWGRVFDRTTKIGAHIFYRG